jgi:hypothetical protein
MFKRIFFYSIILFILSICLQGFLFNNISYIQENSFFNLISYAEEPTNNISVIDIINWTNAIHYWNANIISFKTMGIYSFTGVKYILIKFLQLNQFMDTFNWIGVWFCAISIFFISMGLKVHLEGVMNERFDAIEKRLENIESIQAQNVMNNLLENLQKK